MRPWARFITYGCTFLGENQVKRSPSSPSSSRADSPLVSPLQPPDRVADACDLHIRLVVELGSHDRPRHSTRASVLNGPHGLRRLVRRPGGRQDHGSGRAARRVTLGDPPVDVAEGGEDKGEGASGSAASLAAAVPGSFVTLPRLQLPRRCLIMPVGAVVLAAPSRGSASRPFSPRTPRSPSSCAKVQCWRVFTGRCSM